MKELIQEIVKADERAREELKQIREEKANVSAKMMEMRPNIEARYKKEAEDKIIENKAKLEHELEKKTLQYSVQYEKSLEKLVDRFNKNKEHWVESIYKNCLDS